MTEHPNILAIVTDQQRYDTLGVNGSPICRTPSLDAFAATATRFTHAFACTGLCSPARASLLTGRYPHRHGVLTNVHDGLTLRDMPATERTIAQTLQDAGYATAYVGKWHVGKQKGPGDWGFDDTTLNWDVPKLRNAAGLSVVDGRVREPITLQMRNDAIAVAGTSPYPEEATPECLLADKAIEHLQTYAQGERPFFLRLDFDGPHFPHIVPEPWASMYKPSEIPPDPTFGQSLGPVPFIHDEQIRRWGLDAMHWEDWQPIVAKYWAHVTFVDRQIGRVLATLERCGLAENTVVFFLSDHGDTCGSYNMFDKGYRMYDYIYRIPLIVRWPGISQEGAVCDAFVNTCDILAPTLAEAFELEHSPPFDGRSILPLLDGTTPKVWPDSVFAEFHGMQWGLYSQRMVRTRQHKLVWNLTDVSELYDMDADPYEQRNLYEDEALGDVRQEMFVKLFDWMDNTGDCLAEDHFLRRAHAPHFDGAAHRSSFAGLEMEL